ncbi:MAG: hypothetical protein KF901_05870 [Myxococcales bacterium]|nr:hypothetical protein [Myxococcales bacterium]
MRGATRGRGREGRAPGVAARVLALALVACGASEPADLRLVTPRATVETLLDAYGVAQVSGDEVRRRMQIGRTFHLNDPAARDVCFDELRGDADEGLIGYVFGSLAAGKDELTVSITGETAHVFGTDVEGNRSRPVVLRRSPAGWRIALRESVPADARRRLEQAAAQ